MLRYWEKRAYLRSKFSLLHFSLAQKVLPKKLTPYLLPFKEALTSERSVQETLEKLPDYLERPILYIASLTVRGRLDDLVADVANFMKERYFVGEVVEVVHSGVK